MATFPEAKGFRPLCVAERTDGLEALIEMDVAR